MNPPARRIRGRTALILFALALGCRAHADLGVFTAADIGAPPLAGSSTYNASTDIWTITGSGKDISGTSDQFQFCYRTMTGDGSLITHMISTVVNTDSTTTALSKTALMIRASTAANASFVSVGYTTTDGLQMLYRNGTGTKVNQSGSNIGITAPFWLKLIREGNVFTGYYAATMALPAPSDWTSIGSQTVSMATQSQVGLAACSHDDTKLGVTTESRFYVAASSVPAVPGGLTGTPDDAKATLTWVASPGAYSYNIYRSTSSGGEGTTPMATNVVTTSFSDFATTNGTIYFYQVAAVNDTGVSAFSSEVSVTPSMPSMMGALLPTSEAGGQTWRYLDIAQSPAPAANWYQNSFNDSSWSSAPAPFGTNSGCRTNWASSDIWLRKHFTITGSIPTNQLLRFENDNECEIYINGVQVATRTDYEPYGYYTLSPAAQAALVSGDNVIAVHCHQDTGGQDIDCGLVAVPPAPVQQIVVPTSESVGQIWQYTTTAPAATWSNVDFNDSFWSAGPGGFGTNNFGGAVSRTSWTNSDIWLRRHFVINGPIPLGLGLRVNHDEDCEIYVNGVLVGSATGFITNYIEWAASPVLRGVLLEGDNVIAVHCHQTTGGQYIDVGIVQEPIYASGGDISLLSYEESQGTIYSDNGTTFPAITIFTNNGWNMCRLRLWVNPSGVNPFVSNLSYTIALAQRIKAAGMAFYLDLHYSDVWADPGTQTPPAAWSSLTFAQLTQQVHDYTASTIASFKAAGAQPDIVSIGNEVTNGFLWPNGNTSNYSNYITLVKAGIQGVKDGAGSAIPPQILMHISSGNSWGFTRSWFDPFLAQIPTGTQMIGESFYPVDTSNLSEWQECADSVAIRYGQPVINSEFAWNIGDATPTGASYPHTAAGQGQITSDERSIMWNVPNKLGAGMFYWEPESVHTNWGGQATFNAANFGNVMALPAVQSLSATGNEVSSPTNNQPPTVAIGTAYNYSFQTDDDYTIGGFSLTSGTLPPGLTLSSTGMLTGTPTQAGTYSGTITSGNGTGTAVTQDFTITITTMAATSDSPTMPLWALVILAVLLLMVGSHLKQFAKA